MRSASFSFGTWGWNDQRPIDQPTYANRPRLVRDFASRVVIYGPRDRRQRFGFSGFSVSAYHDQLTPTG